jgi:hypothetical protein
LDFLGTLELSEILNEPSGISWYQGDLIITNCNANNFFIVKEKDILESSGSDSNYYSKVTSVFSGPFGNIADYSTLDSKKNVC